MLCDQVLMSQWENVFREPPEDGLMCEMLWSDPKPAEGRGPSQRGVGVGFGPDVTRNFLQDNKLDLLVRSHEVTVCTRDNTSLAWFYILITHVPVVHKLPLAMLLSKGHSFTWSGFFR